MIPPPPNDYTYLRYFGALNQQQSAELLVLQVKQVPTGWAEVGGDEDLLDISTAAPAADARRLLQTLLTFRSSSGRRFSTRGRPSAVLSRAENIKQILNQAGGAAQETSARLLEPEM